MPKALRFALITLLVPVALALAVGIVFAADRLAEHLRDRGYHTAFFNDVYHMMKPGKNFHRGFEQWFWVRGQEADVVHPLLDPSAADRGSDGIGQGYLFNGIGIKYRQALAQVDP